MPFMYLLHADNTYSDFADYPEPPAKRDDGVWKKGEPTGLDRHIVLTTLDKLKAVFASLAADEQAAFGQVAASVLMFVQFGNDAAAKLVIQNTSIPAELEAVKAQLLACFDD